MLDFVHEAKQRRARLYGIKPNIVPINLVRPVKPVEPVNVAPVGVAQAAPVAAPPKHYTGSEQLPPMISEGHKRYLRKVREERAQKARERAALREAELQRKLERLNMDAERRALVEKYQKMREGEERDYLWINEVMRGVPTAPQKVINIIKETLEKYQATWELLVGPTRWQSIVNARQELAFRIVTEIGWSLPRTAKLIKRDHTTVLYAVRKLQQNNSLQGVASSN